MDGDVTDRPGRVTLFQQSGSTKTVVEAFVRGDGCLVVEGQDIGEGPRQFFDDDDYEYWVIVPAAEKDGLLLELMKAVFRGNGTVTSSFMAWMKERGIGYEFETW
jgi:hypothetical protein